MEIKDLIIFICLFVITCLVYRMYHENIDFFCNDENIKEDLFTKRLAHKLRKIDPKLDKKVDELKFLDGQNRSYTLDKKLIHLCKVNEHGEMYDENQLSLVMIHELAHTLCQSAGHTDEFYAIFNDLLAKATAQGLYDPNMKTDPNYCTY